MKDLFQTWVAAHFPDRKDKILNRIRDMRGGKLNDSNFNTRMRGQGAFADHFSAIFKLAKRRAGLDKPFPKLSTEAFRRPMRKGDQMLMFSDHAPPACEE